MNKLIFCYFSKKKNSTVRGPVASPVKPAHRPGSDPNQPAFWPAQTGAQAGHIPEEAGLLAGPNRAPGRGVARANRSHGRSCRCPGRTRGRAPGEAAVTAGEATRGRGRGEAGEAIKERSSPLSSEVSVGKRGWPESTTRSSTGQRPCSGSRGCVRRLQAIPARFLAPERRGGCCGSSRPL